MRPPAPSEQTPFRVTLFFGPERIGDEGDWRCVFNVKKRSWKGGVQVSVDLSKGQAAGLRAALQVPAWSSEVLSRVSADDRPALDQRIEEVFIQTLCSRKLDLALQSGLEQQSQEIPAHALIDELDRVARTDSEHIFASLRTELDLDDQSHSIP